MAKPLHDLEIEQVVRLLVGWTGKLTWEALVDAHERKNHRSRSRQTLARSAAVKIAFDAAKARLNKHANEPDASNLRSDEIAILKARVSRLEAENQILKAQNAALLQQFVTWQYNAYAHGLTKAKLEAPLPAIDLNPTDKRK